MSWWQGSTNKGYEIKDYGKRRRILAQYKVTIRLFDEIYNSDTPIPVFVGPCHHGMARPQVADRGTASDMEGGCE